MLDFFSKIIGVTSAAAPADRCRYICKHDKECYNIEGTKRSTYFVCDDDYGYDEPVFCGCRL